MKKMLVLSAIVVALLLSSTMLYAQITEKGDTLMVGPLNSEGQPLGALNEAIVGDTTATGERAHSVYKLERGAQYILTDVIQADFPLMIVADKPDDDNRPPIIRCGLREDGSAVNLWWRLFDDATFKNVWMSGVNLDGNGPISWISQEVNAQWKTITYTGCVFEFPYTWWAMFADWGGQNDYIITDCVFKNVGNPTGTTWNGAIFHSSNADTVKIRNSTFYKFGCFAARGAFLLDINHCTFVNSVVHPIDSHNQIMEKIKNSLFVNCHAFSDDDDEIKRHYDQEVKGLMNYAEIQWDPQALDSLYGPGGVYEYTYDPNGDGKLTEDELVWELKNNAWFYTQHITDYWSNWDNVTPNPWMNNYNQAMFDNQDGEWTWELWTFERDTNDVIIDSALVTETHQPFQFFVQENTWNVDPGIKDMQGTDALLATNCDNIRTEWAGGTVDPVKWHNVDDYLAFTWPMDFDLSYTNETLMNGGTDGLPVGDPNWFGYVTAVDDNPNITPVKFTLEQNYPNPFNPSTTVSFSLPQTGKVNLEVYNIVGQKVHTLVNKKMTAGSHSVLFDGSNLSSGVYFYTLTVDNRLTDSKKMILVK